MKKILPFLWFDNNLQQAMDFYQTVFSDFSIVYTNNYGKEGPGKEGLLMSAQFKMADEEFMGLNGGPHFKFTEAVSFFINCDTQEEIDYYWEKLSADGGQKSRCGWLKDKFGLSWQVCTPLLGKLLADPDRAKAGRVMHAMMQMDKIDIAKVEAAAKG
ncbi:VOC family protein [Mucilaginibacter conchicola]|uniref:VOC family protein n=1 Tax=Mucilaginibacter conchicola TaxID=2303333 RepID=A0A372NVH7_9SPHI|nr:VOC family protein [Mucilaginibacter conchicola]RFZ94105.1 VOC family protein [Mucilaginibacter conchicola]